MPSYDLNWRPLMHLISDNLWYLTIVTTLMGQGMELRSSHVPRLISTFRQPIHSVECMLTIIHCCFFLSSYQLFIVAIAFLSLMGTPLYFICSRGQMKRRLYPPTWERGRSEILAPVWRLSFPFEDRSHLDAKPTWLKFILITLFLYMKCWIKFLPPEDAYSQLNYSPYKSLVLLSSTQSMEYTSPYPSPSTTQHTHPYTPPPPSP